MLRHKWWTSNCICKNRDKERELPSNLVWSFGLVIWSRSGRNSNGRYRNFPLVPSAADPRSMPICCTIDRVFIGEGRTSRLWAMEQSIDRDLKCARVDCGRPSLMSPPTYFSFRCNHVTKWPYALLASKKAICRSALNKRTWSSYL